MGRAFEYRKASKLARWDKMAKAFTKIGREIAMAVKAAGANPETNPALRRAVQNAKGVNMPKDRVEAAIKRAVAKDAQSFEEIVYEGYGPFGIAILVETATDNTTRTVANIRSIFNRYEGNLGTSGSLSFVFERKGLFTISLDQNVNLESLELSLIDSGAEEIEKDDSEIIITTSFDDFGNMQNKLERLGLETTSATLRWFPNNTKKLNAEQIKHILTLIERFEDDDDVQNVYHNMLL